jgi:hypothetical protein
VGATPTALAAGITNPQSASPTLQTLHAERNIELLLAEEGLHCASVINCRASPSQQALMVTIMTDWQLRRAGGAGHGLNSAAMSVCRSVSVSEFNSTLGAGPSPAPLMRC